MITSRDDFLRFMPTKAMMSARLGACGIPAHMHNGLVSYLHDGYPTGHFLMAILSNDLKEACARADDDNKPLLWNYIFFLVNYAPGAAWGSPSKVQEWLAMHREARDPTCRCTHRRSDHASYSSHSLDPATQPCHHAGCGCTGFNSIKLADADKDKESP